MKLFVWITLKKLFFFFFSLSLGNLRANGHAVPQGSSEIAANTVATYMALIQEADLFIS